MPRTDRLIGTVAIALLAFAISLALARVAGAEPTPPTAYRLNSGQYFDGHAKQCEHPKSRSALEWVVSRQPMIKVSSEDMVIVSGTNKPWPADSVDGLSGHWHLLGDDERTMIITLDPLAYAHEELIAVSIGIVERHAGKECIEKWAGDAVLVKK